MVEDYKLPSDYLYFVGNHTQDSPRASGDTICATKKCGPTGDRKSRQDSSSSRTMGQGISSNWGHDRQEGGPAVIFETLRMFLGVQNMPLIIRRTQAVSGVGISRLHRKTGYYFATVQTGQLRPMILTTGRKMCWSFMTFYRRTRTLTPDRGYRPAYSAEPETWFRCSPQGRIYAEVGICSTPGAGPVCRRRTCPRISVFGKKDDDASIPIARLNLCPDAAAKAGVPVTLIIAGRRRGVCVRSIATERERTQRFNRFLVLQLGLIEAHEPAALFCPLGPALCCWRRQPRNVCPYFQTGRRIHSSAPARCSSMSLPGVFLDCRRALNCQSALILLEEQNHLQQASIWFYGSAIDFAAYQNRYLWLVRSREARFQRVISRERVRCFWHFCRHCGFDAEVLRFFLF